MSGTKDPSVIEGVTDNDGFQYDVAFSFLSQDETLAVSIGNELRGRMEVFVYSEREKELTGKDGAEEFSLVFERRSRICVVLHRKGWGQTKWTRVEETAIKNRGYEGGYDFLTVIALDKWVMPAWLPKPRIWLSYDRYGLQGAASIIEARVQEAGGQTHEESPREKAARLAQLSRRRDELQGFLQSPKGVTAARTELSNLFSRLREDVSAIQAEGDVPHILFSTPERDTVILRSGTVGTCISWSQQAGNSLRYSALIVKEFMGPDPLGGFAERSRISKKWTLVFTLDEGNQPVWKDSDAGSAYTTRQLSDLYLGEVLERGAEADAMDVNDPYA